MRCRRHGGGGREGSRPSAWLGDWNVPANWSGSVAPNGVGKHAVFSGAGHYNASTDTAVTLGILDISSSGQVDITKGGRSLVDALRDVQARFLVMGFSSDWLHPPYQLKEIANALRATHKHVSYYEVESHYGHDAFLLEREKMEGVIAAFLASGAHTFTFSGGER